MKKFFAKLYIWVLLVVLYAPLVFIAIFSFTESKVLGSWEGFSTDLYRNLLTGQMQGNASLLAAVKNTVLIALVAAAVSTLLGSVAAIGIHNMKGRYRKAVTFLNNIPMINPDIITGVSLFLLFVFLHFSQGYLTVILAHITFCTPYVVLSVMPKLQQMNPNIYEAALDLGATPQVALRKVLIPQLKPGMVSGFILAFTMSLDDFAVTFFTRGTIGLDTLSTYIYTDARKGGLTPELRPLMTLIFLVVLILLRILITLAAVALLAGCSEDRSQILKVYNWSDYIDEEVIPEFEEWYEQQTGEKVKVIYQTFDINETMLSKIEKGHEDYDVVCPSDYIIERMLQNDLLLPLNRDFGSTPNYIDENLSPYIRACFDKMDGKGKNANDYSVGYMWGTTGILYNAKYVTDEEASTWDIVKNPKFADRIFIKDSARDVYSQLILKVKEQDIADGKVTIDQLMNYTSDADIAAVEEYMKDVKPLVAGWEADFGKDQMVHYALPKEGFTVWFDGWVIPKYAQNVKAASYWINFMSRPDIVIRNVEETGYVSVSGAPEVLEAFTDEEFEPIDLSYFFSPADTAVCANPVLYPDKADIERSTQEHDWGENTAKLIEMWSRVKGDNANAFTYILIGLFLVAVAAFAFFANAAKNRRKKSRRKGGRK